MDDNQTLNMVFSALSDPTRRDMLSRLLQADFTVGDLAENYEASLPAISKHIHVLEDAQLVEVRKEGRHKIVSLNLDALEGAQIWLSTMGAGANFFEALEDEIENLFEASS